MAAQSLRLSKSITSAALDSVVHDLKFNVLNVYVSLILSVGFSLVECWEHMGNGPFFWVATAGFGKCYTGGSCRIGLVMNEGLTQGDVCMKEHVTISVSFPTFCQLLVYIISIFPHLYIYNIVLDVCVYVGVYLSMSVSLFKLFYKKKTMRIKLTRSQESLRFKHRGSIKHKTSQSPFVIIFVPNRCRTIPCDFISNQNNIGNSMLRQAISNFSVLALCIEKDTKGMMMLKASL